MIATIHNQQQAYLYTVRVESAVGWCEARNLTHEQARRYAAAATCPTPAAADVNSKGGEQT